MALAPGWRGAHGQMTPLRMVLITAATLVCARLAEAVVHRGTDAVVQALNGHEGVPCVALLAPCGFD